MNSDYKDTGTIRTYLLNQATPEYSAWLEEQIFTDDALFQELLIAEDELIDQYLGDKLTPTERQSFETHFLAAPERQQKLRFSRALRKYVDCGGASEAEETEVVENNSVREPAHHRPPAKKNSFSFLPFTNPVVSYAFAAAMLLVVVGLSWVAYKYWLQQTPEQAGNVFVATLTPGLTRDGGELKRVAIPLGTGIVRLQLELPNDEYGSYRAIVLSSDRSEVWNGSNLHASDQAGTRLIAADIPVNSLASGDYQVRVRGQLADGTFEDVAGYRLRIAR